MIKDQVQRQEGGDGSTNLQGQHITINQGITYSDAKAIALDVFKANALQLSQDAAALARQRAEELTDNFLTELRDKNEGAIGSMSQPGMQMAIYEAQRAYASTGDKELEQLLVNILVDRASQTERSLRQIALDEALKVSSKLTTEHIDALTTNFLLSRTINNGLGNLVTLKQYLDLQIAPFLASLEFNTSCYEHLQYAGCGSVMEIGELPKVENIFRKQYPGLFSKGFVVEDFEAQVGSMNAYHGLIVNSLREGNPVQIGALNEDDLIKKAKRLGMDEETLGKAKAFFLNTTMSEAEIREEVLKLSPPMEKLFDLWSKTKLSKLTLTTVGITIAQANYKRRTNNILDLGSWVK